MTSSESTHALSPEEVTIAVTVYDRREYILQAIQSALDQLPVKVIVVEDSGPDLGLRNFVTQKFGSRIEYFRNPSRRGLFDNWNSCLELCRTRFLSILHDDDFLHPEFVVAMTELVHHAPGCGLYFGRTEIVDENGRKLGNPFPSMSEPWRRLNLKDFTQMNPLMFPGQLINREAALSLGGFRATSQYCGDYEMWVKLTAEFGSAQTTKIVSSIRKHSDWRRGTSRVERNGKIRGLTFVQQKRIVSLLNRRGLNVKFNRKQQLTTAQLPAKFLIWNAAFFSPRHLYYNYRLLLDSPSHNFSYALFKLFAKIFGPWGIRVFSRCCQYWRRMLASINRAGGSAGNKPV